MPDLRRMAMKAMKVMKRVVMMALRVVDCLRCLA